MSGRRVAIINDVTSAGSAVKGTWADLVACGANVIAIGTLAVLGPSIARFAEEGAIALEALATLPYEMWLPADCPLCASGEALTELNPAARGEQS